MKYIPIKISITKSPDPNYGGNHPLGHDGVEIDQFGIGMYYDEGNYDVNGFRYAVTSLPEDRANAYIVRSQGRVVAITSAEAEAWFAQNKPEPEEKFNLEVLQAIKLKKDLAIPLTASDLKALDPNDPLPGITKFKKGFAAKLPPGATT